jgi:6-phosphofructokinase 1
MSKFRRIGVLTSGGDAPGMNAAVRAVTRCANANGVEVVGIYEGYKGLIEGNVKVFGPRDVSNIINLGGTSLYSARCDEFKEEWGMQKAKETCEKYEIDGIVAIGGDGTFRGATDLSLRGTPCIGIPGTIDNDITATDYSIGYDTAMNTVIEMVDRLRDTCESHARCNVVEIMGRNAGYLALNTGIAVGATAICIREIPVTEDEIISRIEEARAAGKRNFIVMVAEGMGSEFGPALTEKIEKITKIETRFARLAHVVRGGSPSVRDRLMGSQMGAKAVEMLLDGQSNMVVCYRHGEIRTSEITWALALDKLFKSEYAGYKKADVEKLLAPFSPEDREIMHQFCATKLEKMKALYRIAMDISN